MVSLTVAMTYYRDVGRTHSQIRRGKDTDGLGKSMNWLPLFSPSQGVTQSPVSIQQQNTAAYVLCLAQGS